MPCSAHFAKGSAIARVAARARALPVIVDTVICATVYSSDDVCRASDVSQSHPGKCIGCRRRWLRAVYMDDSVQTVVQDVSLQQDDCNELQVPKSQCQTSRRCAMRSYSALS